MSTFSDEMASIALDLITEFGEEGEFERIVQGTYDPQSGEAFSETSTEYTGMIVPNDYKERDIDGTIVQRGDVRVYAHTMSEVPAVGDLLTFTGISYILMNVKKTRVNGANVLYTLQLRA